MRPLLPATLAQLRNGGIGRIFHPVNLLVVT